MGVDDFDPLHTLLVNGSVTVAEANAMRRTAPVQRDVADVILHRFCLQPLGEATTDVFTWRFRYYAELVRREPDATLDGLPAAVSRVIATEAGRCDEDNVLARGRAVLRALGAPATTDRGCALNLHTRIFADRIRNNLTHPYLGAYQMAWPDLRPADDHSTPEVGATETSKLLHVTWINEPASRRETETRIRALAATVDWPE